MRCRGQIETNKVLKLFLNRKSFHANEVVSTELKT